MNDESAIQESLDVLVDVLVDFEARGRTTFAAGIKPQMQRRSVNGFDEHQLGFERFAEFLDHAASRGIVEVVRQNGQPVVHLRGRATASAASATRASRRPKVRADLWEAFTNWGTWRRLWDKQAELAVRLPLDSTKDRARQAEIRTNLTTSPERFIDIPGLSQSEQMQWMEEFAEQTEGATGLLLRFALKEEDRKAQAFSQAARSDSRVYARWLDLRVEKVIAAINAWKAEHDVTVDIFETAGEPPEQGDAPDSAKPTSSESIASEDSLRAMVQEAVGRMTYADLLRLPIPIEYTLSHPRA